MRNRLRWLGHVLRKDDGDCMVNKCMPYEVEGVRDDWNQVAERSVRECGLKWEDAQEL